MSFICMKIKDYFHINSFALNLSLRQSLCLTQLLATWGKRSINLTVLMTQNCNHVILFYRHVIGLLSPHRSCQVRKPTQQSSAVTAIRVYMLGTDITRKSLPRYKISHRKEREIWYFSTWGRLFIWLQRRIVVRTFTRVHSIE